MAEATIQLGGGNWAGKSDNLLGYYKEGERFYKQDFTFSRSTTGTYTDKDGYIQEMPYNKLTYSEEIGGSGWQLFRGTITTNVTTAPDGTLTADKYTEDSQSGPHLFRQQSLTVVDGVTYTGSIYLKKGELTSIAVQSNSSDRWVASAVFNLENGTITSGSGIITDAGNGWYRCSITGLAVQNTPDAGLEFLTSVGAGRDGQGLFIWGAQFESGELKTYFPTTTRLNMPRVDYLNNSNGSLILEPQRTNLVTHSSDFSDSSWFKLGLGTASTAIVTTNYATSPEGLNNATRLQVDLNGGTTSSDQSLIYDALTVSSGDNTRSIYVKSNDGNTYDVYFGGTLSSYEIKEVTSEWTRIDATRNFASAGTGYLSIGLRGGTGCSDNADILIYGAQVEAGSYATTLINTSGSSVTRNADSCSITDVADRIGQTEGTLYGEFDFKDHSTGTRRLLCLTDGTSTNRITTYVNGLDKLSVYIVDGGASQADIQATILTDGIIKYAVAYANNNIKLYLNGTQVATDTSATIPSTSNLYIGTENNSLPSNFNWRNCKLYNTALSDSELATLTTL
jgi:hypothetical protein